MACEHASGYMRCPCNGHEMGCSWILLLLKSTQEVTSNMKFTDTLGAISNSTLAKFLPNLYQCVPTKPNMYEWPGISGSWHLITTNENSQPLIVMTFCLHCGSWRNRPSLTIFAFICMYYSMLKNRVKYKWPWASSLVSVGSDGWWLSMLNWSAALVNQVLTQ